jgi:hypothetical protein
VKSSTLILVGAFVATGAIVYQGTMAGASQRPAQSPAEPAQTELAHSQSRTPTPAASVTATPAVVAAKTPALKLTLDQVRQLPRPAPVFGGYSPPASLPPAAEPTEPPPSEVPATPAATPPPATPVASGPTPTPTADPWDIPTPPPFPPPPDNWVQPGPPTEE